MSAYLSRGRGVLIKTRVEHRLSLEELALVLVASDEDEEAEDYFTIADIRHVVATQLVRQGTDALIEASDHIRDADDGGAERLAWARRLITKAYRRDFTEFPDDLAAFERTQAAAS
ncbi:DUF6181 family protein [Streptomyces sp. NPDC058657]|uniref:DUF6181 family protein n=1 Tax=unclassified Streptomyces TaxID=2593676 RepID=UPI003669B799